MAWAPNSRFSNVSNAIPSSARLRANLARSQTQHSTPHPILISARTPQRNWRDLDGAAVKNEICQRSTPSVSRQTRRPHTQGQGRRRRGKRRSRTEEAETAAQLTPPPLPGSQRVGITAQRLLVIFTTALAPRPRRLRSTSTNEFHPRIPLPDSQRVGVTARCWLVLLAPTHAPRPRRLPCAALSRPGLLQPGHPCLWVVAFQRAELSGG